MRLRALLPLGLLAFSALSLAQGITLQRTPKVGDKMTYKMNGTFSVSGVDVVLSGTTLDEVTAVDNGLVTTKSTTKMGVDVMGQHTDVPDTTATSTQKLDGTVTEVKVGDAAPVAAGMRLANLNMLFLPSKPVAIGDTWTSEAKKDDKLGTPGYKLEYKLVGEDKVGAVDTYKITATGGETDGDSPSKVTATYWIDKATGKTVRSLAEYTGVIFDAKYPALDGKMELVLQP